MWKSFDFFVVSEFCCFRNHEICLEAIVLHQKYADCQWNYFFHPHKADSYPRKACFTASELLLYWAIRTSIHCSNNESTSAPVNFQNYFVTSDELTRMNLQTVSSSSRKMLKGELAFNLDYCSCFLFFLLLLSNFFPILISLMSSFFPFPVLSVMSVSHTRSCFSFYPNALWACQTISISTVMLLVFVLFLCYFFSSFSV